jgi:hypothetical protein
MRYNQLAHPNESSLGCVLCVPNAIFDEVTPVRNAGCPLCLLNFHAKGVQLYLCQWYFTTSTDVCQPTQPSTWWKGPYS